MQNQNQYPGAYPPPGQQSWGQQPPPQQGQYNYGAPPPGQSVYGAGPNQYATPQNQYAPPQYPGASPGQYPPQGQQSQWGQPPANQYGAPPPIQGQQWNQPPPAQYPPQQNQWGQPPAQAPFVGSPGPQGYGVPHGAPPQQHFGPPTQASLGYGPVQTANIDVTGDVEAIRGAMKRFGTNEKVLIAAMAKKDPIQMNTIRQQYEQRLMRNLISDLEKETSGYFEKGLVQIARGPLAGDCYTLIGATKGLGTKEAALDDVLVGRSNADINAIKTEYQRIFGKSLDSDLRSDLSAGTEQMYMMIISARRQEDSAPVIPQTIEADVTELQRALGSIVGKNSAQVCEVLITRNDNQLRAISQAYQQRFQKSLNSVIKSKFQGHMEDALLLLLARANNRAEAEAVRLEESMAGQIGTKDQLLVERVVRCHWDRNFMAAVRVAYQRRYNKDLIQRIKGETSGDYRQLLIACVEP